MRTAGLEATRILYPANWLWGLTINTRLNWRLPFVLYCSNIIMFKYIYCSTYLLNKAFNAVLCHRFLYSKIQFALQYRCNERMWNITTLSRVMECEFKPLEEVRCEVKAFNEAGESETSTSQTVETLCICRFHRFIHGLLDTAKKMKKPIFYIWHYRSIGT